MDPRRGAPPGTDPFRPDDGEQEVVVHQRVLHVLAKIEPEGNAVDVHENGLFAVMRCDPIADAPGDRIRICAPVRDQDIRHYDSDGDSESVAAASLIARPSD